MPSPPTQREALSVGQLARRWGISVDRVRRLVQGGHLPGAFTIPSAGRYAATVKIPLATVIQVETEDWAIVPQSNRARSKSRRRRSDSGPAMQHFPELATDPPGGESPAGAQG
jgi:hypothetical protein